MKRESEGESKKEYEYEYDLHVEYDTQDQLRGILEEVAEREGVTCKYCHSPHVVKNGTRGGTQYWICKDCGHGFVAFLKYVFLFSLVVIVACKAFAFPTTTYRLE